VLTTAQKISLRRVREFGSFAILFRRKTAAMMDDVLRVAAPPTRPVDRCCFAHYHGLPGSDALAWAGLSAAFFLLSLMKTARGLGLLRGFGGFLQRGWYKDRRNLQITASIAVAAVAMVLVVWGPLWAWHRIKRCRLAVGTAGLTVGFGLTRFISLHEVDAWNASASWVRTAVALVAGAGVSAVAIGRLCQLIDFCEVRDLAADWRAMIPTLEPDCADTDDQWRFR
jgi:hypothetical protein